MKKIILIFILLLFNYELVFAQTIIEDVEFKKNAVVIKYSDAKPKYTVSKIKEEKGIIVEMMNSKFKLLKDLPINSALVKRIKTEQKNNNSLVFIYTYNELSYDVIDTDGVLSVILKEELSSDLVKDEPKIIMPSNKGEKKKSNYEDIKKDVFDIIPKYKVDMDYTDSDIKYVLKHLALRAGLNIIFSNDVGGNITISLKSIPLDEAFKIILSMKGLVAYELGNNIIKVSTLQSMMDDYKNTPLQTKVFFLNYVRALDIKSQIEAIAQAEGRTNTKCNVDESNNALIVTDTPVGLQLTENLIKKLDKMPKQVMIEAKLIEASLDSGLHTGVQWGYGKEPGGYFPTDLSNNFNSLKGNYVGAPGGVFRKYKDIVTDKEYTIPGVLSTPFGTGVDLPAKEVYGSFAFGRLTDTTLFQVILTAAAKKGKAKVLSNPKVATLNNKEANINITNQIPYTTTEITNTSGGSVSSTKVTYITTGIQLKVLPTITSDGKIIMRINPKVSQPSQPAQFLPPSVDERQADTTVVVEDGETIVIGGLIHDSETEYEYKVPVLGDIPILGYLFKKKGTERDRKELLIFVTPKIVESD